MMARFIVEATPFLFLLDKSIIARKWSFVNSKMKKLNKYFYIDTDCGIGTLVQYTQKSGHKFSIVGIKGKLGSLRHESARQRAAENNLKNEIKSHFSN